MVHPVSIHQRSAWLGRVLRHLILSGLCCNVLLVGAHAAALQDPVDVLQARDSALPAAAGKTLERALSVDTSTSQRNLDLLLEARGSALDATVGAALRVGDLPVRRPMLPMALASATAEAAGATLPPPPLGLQSNEMAAEPSTSVRREWLGTAPAGLSQGGQPSAAFGMAPSAADGGRAQPLTVDPALRHLLSSDAVQFVRDNRFSLLAGAALLAAVCAGIQSFARRS